jgi:hypothetical protein
MIPTNSLSSDKDQIQFIDRIYTDGDAYDVQVLNNIAYVTCGYQGLKIFDVSDPYNIKLLGYLSEEHSGYAHQFYLEFPLMYIGDGRGGLNIVNISDPTSPISISRIKEFYSWDVDVSTIGGDKFAFVGNGYMGDITSGIAIVNITDPINSEIISQVRTGGDVTDVEYKEEMVFLMDVTKGLTVVNVSTKNNPTIISQKAINQNMGALEMYQEYIFTVNYQDGLKLFNMTESKQLMLLKEYSLNISNGWDVKVYSQKNLAFVVDTNYGLKILNIDDNIDPVIVAEYSDESTNYNNIFIDQDYLYLNTNNGLTILKLVINESTNQNSNNVSFIYYPIILFPFLVKYYLKKRNK